MSSAALASLSISDADYTISPRSSSPFTIASPSPRNPSVSIPQIHEPLEGSDYFGDSVYEAPSFSDDAGLSLRRIPRSISADHGPHWSPSQQLLIRQESFEYERYPSPTPSESSIGSFTSYDHSALVYDRIIDTLLASKPNPFTFKAGPRNLFMFDPSKDENFKDEPIPPLMIKRLKVSAPETQILCSTHIPQIRNDPWNAVPHLLGVVERGEWVYMCMKQLSEYNKPPLITVEHYLDFFRQVLQRLTFLHEQGISGLCLSDPSSFMVDLSSDPQTPSGEITYQHLAEQFNRFQYPVRYYLVNFSKATRLPRQASYSLDSTAPNAIFSKSASAAQDIRDCGAMFESLLAHVPQIADTIAPLLNTMDQGHFSIDQFDHLLASVDRSTFESHAIQAHTPDGNRAKETVSGCSSGSPRSKGSLDGQASQLEGASLA